jgi:hypothetical protein
MGGEEFLIGRLDAELLGETTPLKGFGVLAA